MSVATALHRAIAEIRETYGNDDPDWNKLVDWLTSYYAAALVDERDAA